MGYRFSDLVAGLEKVLGYRFSDLVAGLEEGQISFFRFSGCSAQRRKFLGYRLFLSLGPRAFPGRRSIRSSKTSVAPVACCAQVGKENVWT